MPDSESGNSYDKKFLYGLAVSLFFLLEILIRFCNWRASYCAASRTVVGGFLSNPFRFLDSALVAVDVVILVSTMILTGSGGGSAQSAKATVKLARVVRLARSARWLRGIKVLRSCRFVTKLANAQRRSALPTRKRLLESIIERFRVLEESQSWAGRTIDPTKIMQHHVSTGASRVLDRIDQTNKDQSEYAKGQFRAIEGRFADFEARIEALASANQQTAVDSQQAAAALARKLDKLTKLMGGDVDQETPEDGL